MCWYAMFVETGQEDKICELIRTIIKRCAISCDFQLLVPKRKLLEYRGGLLQEVVKTLFPGYVLIKTEQIDILSQFFNQSVHFHRLLRDSSFSPSTIKTEEICQVLYLIDEKGVIGYSKVFVEKQKVRVISGPLKNYAGTIMKIDKRRNRAKVAFLFNSVEHLIDLGVTVLGRSFGNERENIFDVSIKCE